MSKVLQGAKTLKLPTYMQINSLLICVLKSYSDKTIAARIFQKLRAVAAADHVIPDDTYAQIPVEHAQTRYISSAPPIHYTTVCSPKCVVAAPASHYILSPTSSVCNEPAAITI